MKSHRRTIFPLLFIAVAMLLSTPSCTLHLWGPERPGPEVTPAGGQSSIEKIWMDAITGSNGSPFSVVFTNAEITAYLQEQLAADPNNTFQAVQVYFLENRIRIFGTVTSGFASAPALILLLPDVSDAGQVRIVQDKVEVGPISLPANMVTNIVDMLIQVFSGKVGAVSGKYRIRDIIVGTGDLTIRCSVD
jgi:hypothetical protein